MDKYEYKLKLEQIKSFIRAKDYTSAAHIADNINWRKVKSVSTLCMIGELYEDRKQLDKSRELFLMAYDRSPVGRKIIYRLTQIAIKMNNMEEAQEYYEEFLEIAPHDNMKYVLKYEIAKGKGATLLELISILEELKDREYTEEWAFELAYLYHKSGNADKCVEVCDELILWFGEGKYVEKALELKMLYQPLNKPQEDKYRRIKLKQEGVIEVSPTDELLSGEIVRETVKIPSIQSDASRFNTINLQEELAKGMQMIMEAKEQGTVNDTMNNIKKMVGEAPYRYEANQGTTETDKQQETVALDPALHIDFKGILAEDYDGQIRLRVPDAPRQEMQVTGQMSIEDILAEWEKTKEAARVAIEEAEQRRLADIKAKALQEAENMMERLTDIASREETEEIPETQEEPVVSEEEVVFKEPDEAEQVAEEAETEEPVVSEEEVVLQEAVEEEAPLIKLGTEQKKIFTYFVHVSGMEQQLCLALEGARQQKKIDQSSATGNLIIIGGKGSGKTALATDFIKAYQKLSGHNNGKVGKISAAVLNQKDMLKLIEAVEGGFLIIEKAGDLSRESVDRLSGMMEQDTKGLMIILEDDRTGIEKVMSRNPAFSEKFTERIKIPVFTSDELVAFAKTYARENKCKIEEMGVLALYNSISNIQKLDEATTLIEVKEIMDEAIRRANRGGIKRLFGGKRTSEDGFILIKEKDFVGM